jgi:hypothetical protein
VPAIGVGVTDTFSDADIHAMVGSPVDLSMPLGLDDLEFSDELVQAAGAAAGAIYPGLGMAVGLVVDRYGTEFAAPLSGDMVLRLEAMSAEEQAEKIEMLKTLNVEELERENNATRNYSLLEGLGLDNAEKETLWGGTVAPTKRKAETQGKRKSGKGGKRSKKQVEEEPEEANKSDNKTGDEVSEAEVASKVSGRNTAKAKGTAAKNQWALKVQRELEAKDYGDSWNVLVRLWWSREETAGFAGSVSKSLISVDSADE